MSETLLKKITIAHVCGSLSAPEVGVEQPLAVIMGYAKSCEPKTTAYGDSTLFKGDFKAINQETGEMFRSDNLYLPDVASGMLKNAIEGWDGVVEFGFNISIVGVKAKKEGESNKYEYRCKPLMAASDNDPMLALENKLREAAADEADKPARVAKKGGK